MAGATATKDVVWRLQSANWRQYVIYALLCFATFVSWRFLNESLTNFWTRISLFGHGIILQNQFFTNTYDNDNVKFIIIIKKKYIGPVLESDMQTSSPINVLKHKQKERSIKKIYFVQQNCQFLELVEIFSPNISEPRNSK